jgi:hypothetical protein
MPLSQCNPDLKALLSLFLNVIQHFLIESLFIQDYFEMVRQTHLTFSVVAISSLTMVEGY